MPSLRAKMAKWAKFFLGKTKNKLYPVECFNEFAYADYYVAQ